MVHDEKFSQILISKFSLYNMLHYQLHVPILKGAFKRLTITDIWYIPGIYDAFTNFIIECVISRPGLPLKVWIPMKIIFVWLPMYAGIQLHVHKYGMSMFQSCLSIISQYHPFILQYSWRVLNSLSNFDWVLHKNHWDFLYIRRQFQC